jgi:hypothetical protein
MTFNKDQFKKDMKWVGIISIGPAWITICILLGFIAIEPSKPINIAFIIVIGGVFTDLILYITWLSLSALKSSLSALKKRWFE